MIAYLISSMTMAIVPPCKKGLSRQQPASAAPVRQRLLREVKNKLLEQHVGQQAHVSTVLRVQWRVSFTVTKEFILAVCCLL
ncbi:hypothetical protein BC940DRAFT_294632 [Gongronella butleri]|nr:hypothetical protein BC940DRAFT_294632 [Gongronella butleri]